MKHPDEEKEERKKMTLARMANASAFGNLQLLHPGFDNCDLVVDLSKR
jgi:hypothetical protein